MPRLFAFLAALACAGFSLPQDWLVNVDFGAGLAGSSPKVGPAAVGQTTNDFWNWYTRTAPDGSWYSFAALANLRQADGAPTTVGLTVANAPGAWSVGSEDPMYNVYLYPFDGGDVTVTVTNLPAGEYDVYVYAFDGNYELRVDGRSQGMAQSRESPVVNPPIWQPGVQYAPFEQISVQAGEALEVIARPGIDRYAVIAGLQIRGSVADQPEPPVIVTQPQDQQVTEGDVALFAVEAVGTAPLGYQWYFSGTPLTGATGSGLALSNVQPAQAGAYSVVISNAYGTVASSNAVLTVVQPTVPGDWLVNVDFGAGLAGVSPKIGPAAVGKQTNDFWNWYTRTAPDGSWYSFAALANLRQADGAPTTVGLTVANAPGAWGIASDDPMYASYIYPYPPSTGNAVLTLTNLPAREYDFYVYSADGNYELRVAGVSEGIAQCHESPILNPPAWQEGTQYVLFDRVTVQHAQAVELIVRPGAGGYAIIAGMQIQGRTGATSPCALPEGVVAWWKGEDNAQDEQGAHDGETPFGIAYAEGKVGRAFDFDSSFSRVSVPDSPAFELTNAMTLEAWVYPRAYQGMITFRGDNRSGLDTWTLDAYEPGKVRFTLIDAANDAESLLAPLQLSRWQHIAATWERDSGDIRLYVDGTLISHTNTPLIPIGGLDANGAVGIGNHGGTFHQFPFNGLVDELAVYERALSATEIAAIHNAGSSGKCAPEPPPGPPAITRLTPAAGTNGATIVIQGTNFSEAVEENLVRFGAVQAVVTAASTSALAAIVPPGATYGPVTVSVMGRTAYSPEFFVPISAGLGQPITTESFSSGMNLSAGDGPVRVVICDLDGDGRPDLAAGNVYGNTISIYQGIEGSGALTAGSFAPRFELSTGTGEINPYWIVATDLDGDGRPDLISTDHRGNRVGVRRNLATPGPLSGDSFGPLIKFPVGAAPQRAVVFDLDGDARPEILTANSSGSISILPNLGPGLRISGTSFGPAANLPTPPSTQALSVGDLDGDGLPDVVAAHPNTASISVFRNLGNGEPPGPALFAPPVEIPVPPNTIMVRNGDIDGDGKLDLITGSYLGSSFSVLRNLAVPGGLATESFAPPVSFALSGRAHNVGLGDLNGSGMLDLAMATEIASTITVLENLSSPGSFTSQSLGPRILLPTGWNAWGVSVGDLDLDGRPDLVFANQYDDTITLYRNENPLGTAPRIVTQPEGGLVNEGDAALLAVEAVGTPTLSYQWWRNGTQIPGATNPSLTLNPVEYGDAGTYVATVSNAFGAVTSSNAVLEVNRLPVADATATPPLVLSPNNTNAPVVLDGTLSYDPDEDPLAYLWRLNPRAVLGTGVVAVATLPLGLHYIDLVVYDGKASDHDSIRVEVITLAQAADRVLEVVAESGSGSGHSLLASLSAALASIDRSNPVAAIHQLQAFQAQVQAQVAPLDSDLAAEFIQQAQGIIDTLAQGELDAQNLKALVHQDTDKVELEFSGSAGAIHIIEASDNMRHWQKIGVARHLGDGRFQFEDSDTDRHPCRFYRVAIP